jgi:hypothetical protein
MRAAPRLEELNRATTPVSRPNPLVVLWRWRYDIGVLIGVPLIVHGLVDAFGALPLAGLAVPAALVVARKRAGRPPGRGDEARGVRRGWVNAVPPRRPAAFCASGSPRRHGEDPTRYPPISWSGSPHGHGDDVQGREDRAENDGSPHGGHARSPSAAGR